MSTQPKILIVAAEPGVCAAMARGLGPERFEVRQATSVADALMHLDERVDLVISDIHLGSSSGVDLLRRWQERRPMTPFILVAEGGDTASAVEAMKLGAADYITKPVNGDELLVRAVKLLEASRNEERLQQLKSRFDGGTDAEHNHRPNIEIPPGTSLEDLERAAVEKALQLHHGNRTHAAKTLGISVRTLQRKLKAWRLPALTLRHHSPRHDFSFPFAR